MFENIGEKIKTLALVTTWVGIITSILSGFILLIGGAVEGLLIMILGSLGSWIGSFVLYGFGQLITNTDAIAAAAANKGRDPQYPPVAQSVPAATPRAYPPQPAAPAVQSTPWRCAGCGFYNHPRVGTCQRCGVTKEWSANQNV